MSQFAKHPGTRGGRGPSRDLWNLTRWEEIQGDPNAGHYYWSDFHGIPTGFTVTQAGSAGTFNTNIALDGGVAICDAGHTDAGDGANVQLGSGPGCFTPEATSRIAFEARIQSTANSTTGAQFFLGLCDAATAIITGGATAVVNTTNVVDAVAFTTVKSNDGGNAVYTYMDETGESATVSSSAIHTFVDAAWVKLGFVIIGLSTVKWFVNGVEQTAFEHLSSTSSIPSVGMTPSLVVQSDGTVQPIYYIDWLRVAKQYRLS